MNIKSIFASVALLAAAGAAMADDGLTRAQVVDATKQAIAAGQTDNSEAAQGNVNQYTSSLTREQVIAATKQAIASGQIPRNEAYDSQTYQVPRVKSANVDAQLAAKAAKTVQQ